MSSLIGMLCLLSALAATSYALSCTHCNSEEATCSGPSITCASGHQCGSEYTENIVDGFKTLYLDRKCTPSSQCGLRGSTDLKQVHISMITSCCNTDHCTPYVPLFPTTSSNPNGLVCQACMTFNSSWCNTNDTVQCTGEENMCLLQTIHMSGAVSSSAALRGCTTKSMCDLRKFNEVKGIISDIKFICTSGGLSIHNIVLTPAIVCLLMLKLFF